MLNLAPPLVEHEDEVQEAPKPEKKEGSDVMEVSRVPLWQEKVGCPERDWINTSGTHKIP